ncbi:MAG TPA: hypothetical protein VJ729_04625 [Nitrososphaeraceae archaeon]|nr:hypothetical protein [Nitrososphaeraceae archaeon]
MRHNIAYAMNGQIDNYKRFVCTLNITKKLLKITYDMCFKDTGPITIMATIAILSAAAVVVSSQPLVSETNLAFALTGNGQQLPNINAANLFNSRTMVLPSNVKNLVILIPDEAHHSPDQVPAKRYINQTYLPQNAIVSPGTTIVWFSGDKNHDHFINLYDSKNNASMFKSDAFPYNAATKPIKLNNTGTFIYSDSENAKSKETGVNGFVMTGTIKVVDQLLSPGSNTPNNNTANNNNNITKIDTVGSLMVPAKTLNQYISEFKTRGLGVDSTQQFRALRNGGQHVLLVWTSNGIDLNKVLTYLNQITATLPYS